ncbi:MAG: exodeoxyribonuclease III, partial [Pseudomonadota bacterium]|nr:exodeoxyribonuclease III [Pseudomonadota bacterium]
MKVATFNVNGVKGRMPRLLEWLDETMPDIACLQEIKTGDATFPHEPIEAAGYQAIWHGMPRHHGVAILSRAGRPVEIRRGLPGDDADGQARYLEASVGDVRVASVYLPNGNPVGSDNWAYKLRWFARFNAYANTLLTSGGNTILCGDLNVVPTNNDIYNAGSWRFDAVLQPETRALWARLLAQGWTDAARYLHPTERKGLYTFYVNDLALRREAGFRMDFHLLSPSLVPRLSRSVVDRE